jgi:arylsulfatase A-like enzyme
MAVSAARAKFTVSMPLLLATLIFLATCIAVVASARAAKSVVWIASPWVVAPALVGAAWIRGTFLLERSARTRAAAALVFVAAVLGIAYVISRLRVKRVERPRSLARHVIATLVAAGVVGAVGLTLNPALPSVPAKTAHTGRPNVVLIVMDTVRADHTTVYGYDRETTPNLREFARGATVYRNALAASDMTLGSHASLFTGLYPSWHGAHYAAPVHPKGRPLDGRFHTVAEILGSQGYTAVGVAANTAYFPPFFGLTQGFDAFDVRIPVPMQRATETPSLRTAVLNVAGMILDLREVDLQNRRAEDISAAGMELVQRRTPGAPFFLFINYMDAHTPYVPPAGFRSRFPGYDASFRHRQYEALKHALLEERRMLTDPEKVQRAHFVSQYDAAIAYIDEQIGWVFDRLREMRLWENALVIVTGDHGESFGGEQKGLFEHGIGSVDASQIRVPLLIKYPGQTLGETSTLLASHVDVLPTILAVTGSRSPSAIQGRALRDATATTDEPILAEAFVPVEWVKNTPATRAIVWHGKKLIVPAAGPPQLYDVLNDPVDRTNLFADGSADAAVLAARLESWRKSIPAHKDTPGAGLDRQAMDRLKSLGYVQ